VARLPPVIVVDGDSAKAAAHHVALSLHAVSGESPRLAVAGGSVNAAVGYLRRELGELWGRLRLTWVDERCVPFDDAQSNRGEAYRVGALDPEAPPAVELPLFLDGELPAQACERVMGSLAVQFRDELDVLLLGMGEDGHIASLFPGHQLVGSSQLVGSLFDSPKPPAERVTLTLPILRTAGTVIILAAGNGKREAIERLVAGDSKLPATELRGVTIITDQVL
jgi:6-phosphogluconolactonase